MSSPYEDVFNPDRMSKLMDIVPRFNAYVEPKDVVQMGIAGDNLYPSSFHEHRPEATVMEVRSAPDGVELKMRNNDTGEEFIVPKNNAAPELLWEFSPQTFENVLHRAMANGGEDSDDSDGSVVEEVVEFSSPDADVPQSTTDIADITPSALQSIVQELNETRAFANNVVKVLNHQTKELMRVDRTMRSAFQEMGMNVESPLKFSPMFRSEHKAMMGSDSDSSSVASEMSDMSDLSEMSDSSSSSASSAGSDFAAQLLAAD